MNKLQAARKAAAHRFAAQMGLDENALYRATIAVWGNLNPQTVSFDRALSVTAVALSAASEHDAGSAPVS